VDQKARSNFYCGSTPGVYSSNAHWEEDKQTSQGCIRPTFIWKKTNKQVKGMMMKYGMDKVRGGAYTQVSLSFSRIET
jgi:hypothetical protein